MSAPLSACGCRAACSARAAPRAAASTARAAAPAARRRRPRCAMEEDELHAHAGERVRIAVVGDGRPASPPLATVNGTRCRAGRLAGALRPASNFDDASMSRALSSAGNVATSTSARRATTAGPRRRASRATASITCCGRGGRAPSPARSPARGRRAAGAPASRRRRKGRPARRRNPPAGSTAGARPCLLCASAAASASAGSLHLEGPVGLQRRDDGLRERAAVAIDDGDRKRAGSRSARAAEKIEPKNAAMTIGDDEAIITRADR